MKRCEFTKPLATAVAMQSSTPLPASTTDAACVPKIQADAPRPEVSVSLSKLSDTLRLFANGQSDGTQMVRAMAGHSCETAASPC